MLKIHDDVGLIVTYNNKPKHLVEHNSEGLK